jgi:hypothetical protein
MASKVLFIDSESLHGLQPGRVAGAGLASTSIASQAVYQT